MHMAYFVGNANERPKSRVGVYEYLIDDYEIGIESPPTLMTWRHSYRI